MSQTIISPDVRKLKTELAAGELRSLSEMSIFCGVVLAVLLLLLTKTFMGEANRLPVYGALIVLSVSTVWIVFLRHVPKFDARFLVIPMHVAIAGVLAAAVLIDHYNNKAIESIPLFGVTMVLTLFCPFRGLGLLLCSLFYIGLFSMSYWGGDRWPAVVGWHLIAILVIATFRVVYHRWSSSRVDLIIHYMAKTSQTGNFSSEITDGK